MRIFVTGADGFIGSHLTEKLIDLNFDVKALSYYNSFNNIGWLKNINEKKLKNLKIVSGDIRDFNFIHNETKNIDVIFHLASLIGIPYSYLSPRSYVDTNVIGTLNILEATKQNKISKLIHTSTSEVYGTANYVPIDENHPLSAQSPYSASKISADSLAFSYFSSFNLPVTILRPFNTFGPRQSNRAIIPTIITQIANFRKKIKLGNLTTTRDYTYIDDTVMGFVNCISSNDINGKTINLGTGNEYSGEQVLKIISNLMKINTSYKQDNKRFRPIKSEVHRLVSDNKLAKKLIKWKPQYAGKKGFETALTKTINWYLDQENLRNFNTDYNL